MSEPVIPSREELLRLYDDDSELLFEVMDIFLDTVDVMLETLDVALEGGSRTAVGTAAHALKGTVVNFGASTAHRYLIRLEDAARSGDDLGVPAADAIAAVRAVVGALQSLRRDAA